MIASVLVTAALSLLATSASPLHKKGLADMKMKCNHDFALTFDDGPYQWTSEISQNLLKKGAKATFFMNGLNTGCVYAPEYVVHIRQAYADGQQIAHHTWSHLDLTTLTNAQIDAEIQRLDEAFVKIIGVKPRFLRPPFGAMNEPTANYLQQKHGKIIVTWDEDVRDWDAASTASTAAGVVSYFKNLALQAANGAPIAHIVLAHETKQHTVTALSDSVSALQKSGYKLQTVAECLDGEPYVYVGQPQERDATWTCTGNWTPSLTTEDEAELERRQITVTRTTLGPQPTVTRTTANPNDPAPRPCLRTYTAVAGDTCASIGAKHDMSAADVKAANNWVNCDDIWAGTNICITTPPRPGTPVQCAVTYTSRAGDTCASIDQKFGISQGSVGRANSYLNCSDIWSGSAICIPETASSSPCRTYYSTTQTETCASLGNRFGVNAEVIKFWNTFVNCADIWSGTNICASH